MAANLITIYGITRDKKTIQMIFCLIFTFIILQISFVKILGILYISKNNTF